MERKTKLYRDTKNGRILGVCAGLAEYFDIDVTLVRFIAIVLAFASFGTAIVFYFLLGIIMPTKDHSKNETIDIDEKGNVVKDKDKIKKDNSYGRTRNYVGFFLLIIGMWLLFSQFFSWWPIFRWNYIWPIILILVGFLIIAKKDYGNGRK